MSQPRPQTNPSTTPAPAPSPAASAAARAEEQLRALREQRESMRADWDTLMAELGNPAMPTEAELERMIRDLPAQERAELRRYHDETQALKQDSPATTKQLPPRRTENLRIDRHAIRC